jgi:hypothetical protein
MKLALIRYLRIWQTFFEHVTLSLYSSRFYQTVYEKFNGFGIKHFLLCCLLSAVITTCHLFIKFQKIVNYFHQGSTFIASDFNNNDLFDSHLWDAIFEQLPQLSYDGHKVSSTALDDNALLISSARNKNKVILAIDLQGTLPEKSYPLLTILQEAFVIKNSYEKASFLPYSSIGIPKGVIDGKTLKSILGKQVSSFQKYFLYQMVLLMWLLNIYYEVLQNLFLIALATVFVRFVFQKDIRSGIRITLFATSGIILLRALVNLFVPNSSFVHYYCAVTVFFASRAITWSQSRRPLK